MTVREASSRPFLSGRRRVAAAAIALEILAGSVSAFALSASDPASQSRVMSVVSSARGNEDALVAAVSSAVMSDPSLAPFFVDFAATRLSASMAIGRGLGEAVSSMLDNVEKGYAQPNVKSSLVLISSSVAGAPSNVSQLMNLAFTSGASNSSTFVASNSNSLVERASIKAAASQQVQVNAVSPSAVRRPAPPPKPPPKPKKPPPPRPSPN